MQFRDYKYVIVVDKHNRPMRFLPQDGQLCYCDDENWLDDVNAIKPVTKATAKKQIKTTIKNRKEWGMHKQDDVYKMMPVEWNG